MYNCKVIISVGFFTAAVYLALTYYVSSMDKAKSTKELLTTEGCPSGPIVSVVHGGRLCNQIWEFASAWLVGRLLDRPIFIDSRIIDTLHMVFEPLSVGSMSDIAHCNISFDPPMEREQIELLIDNLARRFEGRHILLPAFSQIYLPMLPFRSELKKGLRFRDEILLEAENTIAAALDRERVLVGVHVRRTDFTSYLAKQHIDITNATYFKNAMDWYRQRIDGEVLFLVVSDDERWCEENLASMKNVKVVSKNAGHDLALLSLCNHTIIDYGTFGFWGWFLSSGHTISLNIDTEWVVGDANWTFFDKDTLQEIEVN